MCFQLIWMEVGFMFDELPGSVIKNLSRPITLSNPCSTGTLQRWSGWGRWGSKTRGAPRIPPPSPVNKAQERQTKITVSRETALVTIFNVVQKTSRGNGPTAGLRFLQLLRPAPPVVGGRRRRWRLRRLARSPPPTPAPTRRMQHPPLPPPPPGRSLHVWHGC